MVAVLNTEPDPVSFLKAWIGCSEADEASLRAALAGRVLDVGAGAGSKIDPCSAVGLDKTVPRLAVAIDRAFPVRPSFGRCVIGDLDGKPLPFSNGAFDVALCMHVLEHLGKPQALVRELARVVRPGGWLFVAVPNGWSLSDNLYKLWKLIFFLLKGERIPHVQRFTFKSVKRLLTGPDCTVAYTARIGENWGWLTKHPKARTLLLRLTRSSFRPFLSYGWLFVVRTFDPGRGRP